MKIVIIGDDLCRYEAVIEEPPNKMKAVGETPDEALNNVLQLHKAVMYET